MKLLKILGWIFGILLCLVFPPLAGLVLGIVVFAIIWGMLNKNQQGTTNVYVESPRILVVQPPQQPIRSFRTEDWDVLPPKQLS